MAMITYMDTKVRGDFIRDDDPLIELKKIVGKFLVEHFHIDSNTFAARREENVLGNRRFGFSHYMIGNVEVAMLTGDNDRYAEQINNVSRIRRDTREACYMEFYAPSFMISTIVVLDSKYADSKVHPSVKIFTSVMLQLVDFRFNGEYKAAKSHFAFAKLTK